MAGAEVGCRDCHEVAANYPDAIEHEGTFVLASPPPPNANLATKPK